MPLLTDKELHQRLSQEGQKQAKLFRCETCAEKTLETYQEAFEVHKQRNARKSLIRV